MEKMKELERRLNGAEDALNALTAAFNELADDCHGEALSWVEGAPDKAEDALKTELRLNALAGACIQCLNVLGVYGGGGMEQVRGHFEPSAATARKGGRK